MTRIALALFVALALASALDAAQITKLTASDGGPGDQYGRDVALSGETLAVGARRADDPLGQPAGKAYVYVRQGGAWVEQAVLSASDPLSGAEFGHAVALDDDVLVVGAPFEDELGAGAGAAYVFERSGGAWAQVAKLLAPDGGADDRFGFALDLEGDVLAVGSVHDDTPHSGDAGSVWLFERVAGAWTPQAKVFADDGQPSDDFGYSLDLSGDRLLVGAWGDDDAGNLSGSIYWFERSGAAWSQTAKRVSPAGAFSQFGRYVALDGDLAAASSEPPFSGPARIHVYGLAANGWTPEALLEADAASNGSAASSLELRAERLAVGVADDSSAGLNQAGAAYVFARDGGHWGRIAKVVAPDAAPVDAFGFSVALRGSTLAIGALLDDDLGDGSGSVYVLEADFELVEPFCFGAPPAACPCGNLAASGGCANTTGAGGLLERTGSVSALADDLVLRATSLPPFQPAIVVMSVASAPPSPLGDGLLCLAAPVYRFPSSMSDGGGVAAWGPGLAALSSLLFPAGAQLAPGETRLFQTWHRDPAGPCGSSTNLTSGLEVTFLP